METDKNLPIEHQSVPVSHRGLHDFLYSDENEHAPTEVNFTPQANNDADIIPLEAWCALSQNAKIAGVYAVLDTERNTQYTDLANGTAVYY